MTEPTPERFLVESDLEALETYRKWFTAEHERALWALKRLREKLTDREALGYLNLLEGVVNGQHTVLVAALDARVSEITDEALGHDASD